MERYIKLLLPLAFMAHSSLPLLAQRSGLGIKGGPLMSTTRSEVIENFPLPGAVIGVYAPVNIGPGLEIQPELLVAAMGSGYNKPKGDVVIERTIYILTPLSLKWYTGNGFNLQGGIQAGNLLSATRREGTEDAEDITERYNGMDVGFNGGLGVDFRSGVDITLRYYSGVTPVLEADDALFPRNRSLQFTVGYRIVQFSKASRRRR